jgi:hypothetical protein
MHYPVVVDVMLNHAHEITPGIRARCILAARRSTAAGGVARERIDVGGKVSYSAFPAGAFNAGFRGS